MVSGGDRIRRSDGAAVGCGDWEQDKDKREHILLLAELAEATGAVTLETVGQGRESQIAGPRKG